MKSILKERALAFVIAGLATFSLPGTRQAYADEIASDARVITDDPSSVESGEEVVPFDDHDADRDHSHADYQCRRFDGYPNYCQRSPGCAYDYRYNRCVGRHGGGQPYPPQPYPPQPQPYFCQQFNYNQYQCQRNGCFYDYSSQYCFAQGGSPQPPPGGRGIVCSAVDAGWEEHSGGHRGIGINQYAAQQAAMGDCLRYHARCRIAQCQAY